MATSTRIMGLSRRKAGPPRDCGWVAARRGQSLTRPTKTSQATKPYLQGRFT